MYNVHTRVNDVITFVGKSTHKQVECELFHMRHSGYAILKEWNAENGFNIVLRDTNRKDGRDVVITYNEASMDWMRESF